MKSQTVMIAIKEVVLAEDDYYVVRTTEDRFYYIKTPDVLIEVEPVAALDYTGESEFWKHQEVLDKLFVHLCHGKNTASIDGHQQYLWFEKEDPDKYYSSHIHVLSREDNSNGVPKIIVDADIDGTVLDCDDFWVDVTKDGRFLYDVPEEEKCVEDREEYPKEVKCVARLNYDYAHIVVYWEGLNVLDELFDSVCSGERLRNSYAAYQYLWFK